MTKLDEYLEENIKYCGQCGKPVVVYEDDDGDLASLQACRMLSYGAVFWLCDESCCPTHGR